MQGGWRASLQQSARRLTGKPPYGWQCVDAAAGPEPALGSQAPVHARHQERACLRQQLTREVGEAAKLTP